MNKPVVYIISKDRYIADSLNFHTALTRTKVRIKSRIECIPKSTYNPDQIWFLDYRGETIEEAVRNYWKIRGEPLFGMVPLILSVDDPIALKKRLGIGENLWITGKDPFSTGLVPAIREAYGLLTKFTDFFHKRLDIFNAEISESYEDVEDILKSITPDSNTTELLFAAYCNIAIKAEKNSKNEAAIHLLEQAKKIFPDQKKIIENQLKLIKKTINLRKSG